MKKKLDWLKIKLKVVINELNVVKRNLGDVQTIIDSLVAEREDVHRSWMSVERDKKLHLKQSTGSVTPKRATRRTLLMHNHSEAMQQFIEDHVTGDGLTALMALQATEEELSKVTVTLQSQFERAEKANDKLEDAYNLLIASRSITEDDTATTIDMLSNQHSVGSTELQEIINNSTFGGNSLLAQSEEEVQCQPLTAPNTLSDYTADTSFSPDPFLHKLTHVGNSSHNNNINNLNNNNTNNNNNLNNSNNNDTINNASTN